MYDIYCNLIISTDVITERIDLNEMLCVNSYNYLNVLIGYGPKKEVTCNITWCFVTNSFQIIFLGGINAVNGHSVMRDQLSALLNEQHRICALIDILDATYNPLASIAKLPIVPHLGTPVSCITLYYQIHKRMLKNFEI